MIKLEKRDITEMESRYRAALINSMAGFRQAVLIGTKSAAGVENLAIFNSLIHIGSSPALYGFISRPDSVQRDTLQNIAETGYYTFNYVKSVDFKKAHQTSAKYPENVSEFDAVGFTPTYIAPFYPPFVTESVVRICLQLEEKIDIKLNGTILMIGSIEYAEFNESLLEPDGFLSLGSGDVLGCAGLDAYFRTEPLGRLSYAKPEKLPELL